MAYASYSEPWSERLKAQLEHHANTQLIIGIVFAIVIGLHPLPGVLGVFAALLLMAFVLVAFSMMRAHDRKLCGLCASDISMTPHDEASRVARRFWVVHTLAEPRFLVLYVVVLIGSNFLPGLLGHVVWAAAQASMIYVLVAVQAHRRLQPWCPWADAVAARRRLTKRRRSCAGTSATS